MAIGHSEPRQSGWGWQNVAQYAVIGLCHAPMLAPQLYRLWQIECYRYVPFLLAVVAFLLYGRWRQLPTRPVCQPTRASLATLLVGLVLLLAAVLLGSPWLGMVAAIVSLLAVLLSFGPLATASLGPVWALLWLVLPLPFRGDQRLVLWLQGRAAEGGSLLLDAWGYNHVLAGYVLEIPGREFPVEELGRGLQTLFALIATAGVLAVWQRRTWVVGVLLVCTAPFWAMAMNTIGVALTVVLASGGTDVATNGAGHLFVAGLFLSQFLILLSADRLLLFLTVSPGLQPGEDEEGNLVGVPEELDETVPAVPTPEPEPPVLVDSAARRLGLGVLTVAFVAVGLFQEAAWMVRSPRASAATVPVPISGIRGSVPLTDVLGAASLPPSLGPWRSVDFRVTTRALENNMGRYSLAWCYADARDDAVVSLDFPFTSWQDPAGDFELRGWEIESRTEAADQAPAEAAGGRGLEVRMRDASGRRGYLLVRRFTDTGQAIAPPARSGWSLSALCRNAVDRVLSRLGEAGDEPVTYQVQLLVVGDLPLDEDQQNQARQAFQLAAARIAEQLWPRTSQ